MTEAMMKSITGFFEEKPHVKSWTRLSMSWIIITACVCALIVVIAAAAKGEFDHDTLILGMFTVGTGGKVVQKVFGEKKTETKID
jgi:glycerol uptake facilitator-like aquaporin